MSVYAMKMSTLETISADYAAELAPDAPSPVETIRVDFGAHPEYLPIGMQAGIVDTIPRAYIDLMVNDPNGPEDHFTPIPLGQYLRDMEARLMAAIEGRS